MHGLNQNIQRKSSKEKTHCLGIEKAHVHLQRNMTTRNRNATHEKKLKGRTRSAEDHVLLSTEDSLL